MANLPVKHLSYSQLELWTKCPRQWKFRYVDKMDSDPWLAAWAGSAFHTWVEDWEASPKDPETYGGYFDDQLEFEYSKTDKAPQISQGDTVDVWRELGVELCRKWLVWRLQEGHEVLLNEAQFVVPLPGLKLPIKGFVDALLVGEILDWKTGRKMPGSTQLKIYGAVMKALGWDAQTGSYYNARTGKVGKKYELDYSLAEVAELFKPLDDGIQEGVYPPNPDYHCKWCPGLAQCHEGMNRVGRPRS